MADQVLDAKGLNCPLPILRAKKTLAGMAAGQTLEIVATDPGSIKDFEAVCRTTGNSRRSAQTSSCSAAAARKVSAATRST